MSKNHSKDQEIRRLKEKLEELDRTFESLSEGSSGVSCNRPTHRTKIDGVQQASMFIFLDYCNLQRRYQVIRWILQLNRVGYDEKTSVQNEIKTELQRGV